MSFSSLAEKVPPVHLGPPAGVPAGPPVLPGVPAGVLGVQPVEGMMSDVNVETWCQGASLNTVTFASACDV